MQLNIVFVCLGNICRSPMAEFVFKSLLVKEKTKGKIFVSSAATSSYEEGEPVHRGTKKVLEKYKISMETKHSIPLNESHKKADYLVAMDTSNLKNIEAFLSMPSKSFSSKEDNKPEVKLFLSYAGEERSIADPYYTLDFESTYQDVLKASQAFLAHLKKEKPEFFVD